MRLVEVAVAQPQHFQECRRCQSPGHLEPELLIPEVFAAEEIFRVQLEILNCFGDVPQEPRLEVARLIAE
jgi:hypothetical protein